MNEGNLVPIPARAVEFYMLPFMSSPWPVKLAIGFVVMIVAISLCWWLIKLQNKSTGRRTHDYWEIIQKDPMAVAYSRRTVFFSVFGLVGTIMWKVLS